MTVIKNVLLAAAALAAGAGFEECFVEGDDFFAKGDAETLAGGAGHDGHDFGGQMPGVEVGSVTVGAHECFLFHSPATPQQIRP